MSDTVAIRRESEWKIKQIAVSSFLSFGAAVVAGTTVWTFLQSQFAPNKLTSYQLAEQERHIMRLEQRVDELEDENHDLRVYLEALKNK